MRTAVLFHIPSDLTGLLSLRDPGGGYCVSHRHASQRRHGMVAREARFPGEPRRQLHLLAAGLVNCVSSSSFSKVSKQSCRSEAKAEIHVEALACWFSIRNALYRYIYN